jgi:hypothetical protein
MSTTARWVVLTGVTMPLKLDLKEHVSEPEGGGVPTTLQNIAQDLHDMECIENELTEAHEHVDTATGEKALNLSLAIDCIQLVRASLARGLCLLTLWAERLNEITVVEIDDTPKPFLEGIDLEPETETETELVPNTVAVKGRN